MRCPTTERGQTVARKRLISPEFFTHPGLYDAEAASGLPIRLAFAGLWTASDRRGLFEWNPRILKLAILPYDPCDFGAVLNTLDGAGFVQRYVVDGKEYGRIPSFKEWQTFHPHEKPSKAPEPPDVIAEPTIVRPEPTKVRTDHSASIAVTASSTAPIAVSGPPSPKPEKQEEPEGDCSVVPEEFADDLEQLLRVVKNPTAWVAEVRAIRQGMRGKDTHPNAQQMGQAIRDYLAFAPAEHSLNHFRRFVQRAIKDEKPRTTNNLAADKTVRAMEIVNIVRTKRRPGYLDQFSPVERRALDLVDIDRIKNADPKELGFLQSHIAKALAAGVSA